MFKDIEWLLRLRGRAVGSMTDDLQPEAKLLLRICGAIFSPWAERNEDDFPFDGLRWPYGTKLAKSYSVVWILAKAADFNWP
jgi:hypothetical protein